MGKNIGKIARKIVKEKPNGKLDIVYLKRSIGENIEKLKLEINKKGR